MESQTPVLGQHRAWRRMGALGLIVALAFGTLFAMRIGQGRLVYFPPRAVPGPASDFAPGAETVTLTTADGLDLTAWYLPPTVGSPDRDQAVLAAHGNGGSVPGLAPLGRLLADRGFGVLLLGYRGFSGNPGSPAEVGLIRDARAGFDELVTRGYSPDRIILFGESIGTGVVTGLATELARDSAGRPAGLVLRSPFTSVIDVGRNATGLPTAVVRFVLSRNNYPVLDQLGSLNIPVSVIQGTTDTIVPPAQSDAVAATAPDLVEHLVLDGAGHNDAIMYGPPIADAVVRLGDAVIPAG